MRSTVLSFDDEPIQVLALCSEADAFLSQDAELKINHSALALYTMKGDAFFLFYSCRKIPQRYYPIKEYKPRQLKFLGKPVTDANQETRKRKL
jgi:hypothetical protein